MQVMLLPPARPSVMDPDQLSLSVVIPCYNREGSVRAAVQSVLDQTWAGAWDPARFSVIAVDDGSTDSTLSVLDGMDDSRLTVVANSGPKGACGARNFGAATTDSDWVAFQDSDDLWHPDKLARQVAALAAAGPTCVAAYCAMAVCGAPSLGASEGPVLRRIPASRASGPLSGNVLPALVWSSLASTQTLVVRRDAFNAAAGFDPDMPALQDWDLMLRVAGLGNVAYVDEALVDQRMSDNSITRSSAKRLAAQERLMTNHADLWARFPAAAAHHYYRIAGACRQVNAHDVAARVTLAAMHLAPTNPKYRLMYAYLRLRTVFGFSAPQR